ncbi:hypothetical protein ABH944_006119 [Caballeronia udeis]|uniref:Uncharacterized protein n=1 Tax=Caballeronia udeis TaxID=1232866 RepID=A0ABW8MQF3_9BURK
MAFKQTEGNVTVEACVLPSPGQMFKGALRVTTVRDTKTIERVTGRGCGRPMRDADAALAMAETAAKQMLGV